MILYHGSYMIIDKPVIIKNEFGRGYDIVTGKIANDNVGETALQYLKYIGFEDCR